MIVDILAIVVVCTAVAIIVYGICGYTLIPLAERFARKRPKTALNESTMVVCPDCGGAAFLGGPCGGMCQNVKCAGCGSEYNLTPFSLERLVR